MSDEKNELDFDAVDANDDGVITEKELEDAVKEEEKVDEIIVEEEVKEEAVVEEAPKEEKKPKKKKSKAKATKTPEEEHKELLRKIAKDRQKGVASDVIRWRRLGRRV